MAYNVEITPQARRAIQKLPPEIAAAAFALFERLADNPRLLGSKKLSGSDQYRIRFGDYRVLYGIQDKMLIVSIFKVAHRREVYRK
ncbi:type II toxin-antitoxin system RelE/ParE family toxin [Desulfovibrio sp. OttesenSCG-928-M14]|nr:type II toxin-antitoxin system RelE/ParE family toxin [Desulfovibrio sp. OttesenSCG-928-M14]